MLIVILKFCEVAARAGFVVFTTYSLSLTQTGQFGLFVTLQGLASFAFGYERHVDIQRRMVGEPELVFDQAVSRALTLFGVNYLIIIPFFLAALVLMVKINSYLLVLCIVIAVAEQLMNQAYQMSMVNRRYLPFLFIAVATKILIAILILGNVFVLKQTLVLERVLQIWSLVSVCGVMASGIVWWWNKKPEAGGDKLKTGGVLWMQYKASRHHFLLGLTAILTLQFDRLAIGALLPLETVGIYFRHVLLLSLVYQVFNIASFNRIVPKIFLAAKTASVPELSYSVGREYKRVLAFVAFICTIAFAVHWASNYAIAERFHLNPAYFLGLLLASVLRMRADFNGLIFNARLREKTILKLQLIAFGVGAVLIVILTRIYGIPGIIAASGISAAIYLLLTMRALGPLAQKDLRT